ncbi:serine hydrolase [Mycobacterium sp. IS-836]|uniref:serine hydrolase domain-containing protein n=1 Tax=Mycobacterium sp. IS-836 TaxID=1834160 RepID=UPI00096CBDC1|nr:serine hydrolase [Mycobacterium sp. IS-836]
MAWPVRTAITVGAVLLILALPSSRGYPGHLAAHGSAVATQPTQAMQPPQATQPTQAMQPPQATAPIQATEPPQATPPPAAGAAGDFAAVAKLMNNAVAANRLPGAVVVIGHAGNVVFHQAFGSRKLAGEQGLDGSPAPAEPMTEDTIFDLASLTKCLATAIAVMQLYEQGKVGFDDPVQNYLPEFNAGNDPQRAGVTLRMLLTNTSGEPIDVNLGDPWGLDGPDKAEGIRRALTTPLQSGPGEVFRYSDINFLLLGALLEKITGQAEDVYVEQNVFGPLGMEDTRYLPPASLLPRIAPTALDEENRADPSKNPDYGHLLRGTVHDPTARRMGGVAGNAGVFATAHDVSIFAQALLDRLAGRPSKFPLQQVTLEMMTTPEQPGHSARQLQAANDAARRATVPSYPAINGQNLFGFGWDIDTPFSRPRGSIFPVGSFGNTGFTGTTLWLDPESDTYVILLSNAIHVRGSSPISDLRGEVATEAARGLGLYGSAPSSSTPKPLRQH